MEPRYTITKESVTVIIDGKTYTVKNGDPSFGEAREAVLREDWERIPILLSKGLGIEKWAKGLFTFRNNFLYYMEDRLSNEMNNRIIAMATAGENPSFLLRFWERLQNNPSWNSVHHLYRFLENHGIAIDQDGTILCYKSVTRDYRDWHSNSIDNTPGQKPRMPRNKISDDYESPCHTGFHVGNLEYATGFHQGNGNRIIICRVDPADVVCVPKVETNKMRVCAYEVLGNYGGTLPSTTFDTTKDKAVQGDMESSASSFADALKGNDRLMGMLSRDMLGNATRKSSGEGVSDLRDEWRALSEMSDDEVSIQSVEILRKYASRSLRIVNASKLRKEELVARILDVRSK